MKRVLLIGGGGFIGSNLRDAFSAAGHAVAVVDTPGRAAATGCHGIALHDDAALAGLMQTLGTELVVHLACGLLPSSDFAAFEREQQQVLAPSFRLMDHCARRGLRFLLMSSGGTVYGDAGAQPVHEGQPLAPKNLYGLSKLMLEEYARLSHRAHGLQYLVLRPSNPYGRHQRLHGEQGIVAVALGRALRGAIGGVPLEIWGDGGAVRDYLDVRDLAAAVLALVDHDVVNTALNIGSGVGHSINEVLAIVREVTGAELPVVYRPPRGVDVRAIVLGTQALAAAISWQPRALRSGIGDFHRLLRESEAGDGR
jgi:UDP-glucose 4-epimerase